MVGGSPVRSIRRECALEVWGIALNNEDVAALCNNIANEYKTATVVILGANFVTTYEVADDVDADNKEFKPNYQQQVNNSISNISKISSESTSEEFVQAFQQLGQNKSPKMDEILIGLKQRVGFDKVPIHPKLKQDQLELIYHHSGRSIRSMAFEASIQVEQEDAMLLKKECDNCLLF
ncbi:hypothetical protein KFK09_008737 [Dendrobium nobile]|uniref:Uncharacterized protein n=1 Tax=Dendrobium nobile TaxID=94219 RepID=A0A8T3BNV7_DENNO|nr:hypothetical protein KFK09_008737 [Dendrobium nobile]